MAIVIDQSDPCGIGVLYSVTSGKSKLLNIAYETGEPVDTGMLL